MGNIFWKDIPAEAVVIDNGASFSTSDGQLINWTSQDAKEAQSYLQSIAVKADLMEVLNRCTIEGNVVKLPPGQLDRKLYDLVRKKLEGAMGKWKGGKIAGFVFPHDPAPFMDKIRGGESVNLKKEFQFYPTPTCLAYEMVQRANIQSNSFVLEPSAGDGALLKEIQYDISINSHKNVNVHYYELMAVNRSKILACAPLGDMVFMGEDFLKADDTLKYHRIIANPPFSKNQDITHIRKMYSLLAEGGVLVTICGAHYKNNTNKIETAFRDWLKEVNAEVTDLPKDSFKESGANFSYVLITIKK